MNHDIQGNLENTRCPEIIKILTLGKRAGRLFISSGSETGSIYFKDGKIIHAKCGNIEGVKAIYEMAAWSSGSYKFFIDESSDLITINIPADEILRETENRIRQMEKIASLIPSANTVFTLENDIKDKEVILKAVQWKMLSFIDGKKTISEIAQTIGISDSDAMKVFYTLFRQGLIRDSEQGASSNQQKNSGLPETDFISNLVKNLTIAIGPIAPIIVSETANENSIDLLSDDITQRAIMIETLHSRIPDENAGLAFLDSMAEWLKNGDSQ